MKRYMKKIATGLLAVMLFSTMALTSHASIRQDYYSVYASTTSYTQIADKREKQDATPLYLSINENYMTSSYFARAMGRTANGTTGTNLTYSNGDLRDYVRCTKNAMWAIQSLVYERNCQYCYITIKANGVGATTSGYWAPDTDPSKGYTLAPY